MDEAIGNVTYAMKAAKMWTNCVFVLSNDNGGWLGYGGLNCKHWYIHLSVISGSMIWTCDLWVRL